MYPVTQRPAAKARPHRGRLQERRVCLSAEHRDCRRLIRARRVREWIDDPRRSSLACASGSYRFGAVINHIRPDRSALSRILSPGDRLWAAGLLTGRGLGKRLGLARKPSSAPNTNPKRQRGDRWLRRQIGTSLTLRVGKSHDDSRHGDFATVSIPGTGRPRFGEDGSRAQLDPVDPDSRRVVHSRTHRIPGAVSL